jgi:hypothetical protein
MIGPGQLSCGENRKGHRVRHQIGLELLWGLVHLLIIYLLRSSPSLHVYRFEQPN